MIVLQNKIACHLSDSFRLFLLLSWKKNIKHNKCILLNPTKEKLWRGGFSYLLNAGYVSGPITTVLAGCYLLQVTSSNWPRHKGYLIESGLHQGRSTCLRWECIQSLKKMSLRSFSLTLDPGSQKMSSEFFQRLVLRPLCWLHPHTDSLLIMSTGSFRSHTLPKKASFPAVAAAAKSLQSCPTLCDPIDGSPPGSPVPGILQARTLEWVAISLSSAWKWKVKVKPLSRVRLLATPWTATHQAPPSFPGKSTGGVCHCFLCLSGQH